MTNSEALDMIETVFEQGADGIATGLVDVVVAGISADQAQADVDSYLAAIGMSVEDGSIEITPDFVDDAGMVAAMIVVKTEGS